MLLGLNSNNLPRLDRFDRGQSSRHQLKQVLERVARRAKNDHPQVPVRKVLPETRDFGRQSQVLEIVRLQPL
jgi:hypothetical protein